MKKHPFDPISFLFGVLFLAGGLYLATGNAELAAFENQRMWPLIVIVAGLLFLVPALSDRGGRRPAPAPEAMGGREGDDAGSEDEVRSRGDVEEPSPEEKNGGAKEAT